MNKNTLRDLTWLAGAFCVLLILGGSGSLASAQDNPGESDALSEGQGRQGAQLGRLLELTPEQLRQVFVINQRIAPELRRARQRMALAQQELDAAIYGDVADDALVLARVQEFNQAQNEFSRLRTLREYRFRQLLTPEQLVRLRDIRRQAQEQAGANRRRNDNPNTFAPNRRRIQPGTRNPGTTFQQRQPQPQPQQQNSSPAKRPQ